MTRRTRRSLPLLSTARRVPAPRLATRLRDVNQRTLRDIGTVSVMTISGAELRG